MAEKTITYNSSTSGHVYDTFQQTAASGAVLWAGIYDGAGDGSGTTERAGWSEGTNWDATMWRARLKFDLSALNGATVITAKILLSGTQYWRNIFEGTTIGSSTGTSYSDIKTTTDFGSLVDQGTGSGNGAGAFTDEEAILNAAGIAAINAAGSLVTFSYRGEGDTSDRGTTSPDDYTHVTLSNAKLVVTYSPILVFEESISATDTMAQKRDKTLSESITTTQALRINNELPGKTFSESINLSETFIGGIFFTKTLTDGIIAGERLVKQLNGILVGKWTKAAKKVSSWTEQARENSRWRKTPRK
jgi:hypothetical protein